MNCSAVNHSHIMLVHTHADRAHIEHTHTHMSRHATNIKGVYTDTYIHICSGMPTVCKIHVYVQHTHAGMHIGKHTKHVDNRYMWRHTHKHRHMYANMHTCAGTSMDKHNMNTHAHICSQVHIHIHSVQASRSTNLYSMHIYTLTCMHTQECIQTHHAHSHTCTQYMQTHHTS